MAWIWYYIFRRDKDKEKKKEIPKKVSKEKLLSLKSVFKSLLGITVFGLLWSLIFYSLSNVIPSLFIVEMAILGALIFGAGVTFLIMTIIIAIIKAIVDKITRK